MATRPTVKKAVNVARIFFFLRRDSEGSYRAWAKLELKIIYN